MSRLDPMVVVSDVGRSTVKALRGDKEGVSQILDPFSSYVGEWHPRDLNNNQYNKNFEVVINGQQYFIADLAKTESVHGRIMATETKFHADTQVLFLSSVALVLPPERLDFSPITCVPVKYYRQESIDELKKLLEGNDYEVSVNGQTRHFSIKNLSVTVEGGATYWDLVLDGRGKVRSEARAMALLNGTTRMIEVGSRSVNLVTFEAGGGYIDRESKSLGYGTYSLENSGITDFSKGQFVQKLKGDAMFKWTSYTAKDNLILCGGGTLLLGQKLLREHFGDFVSPSQSTLLHSNALGAFKMWFQQNG